MSEPYSCNQHPGSATCGCPASVRRAPALKEPRQRIVTIHCDQRGITRDPISSYTTGDWPGPLKDAR